MKYYILTYGCQMNTADSEEMARPFEARGFVPTADPAEADVILMNTCTVRDQAEHRAWSNLGRLKEWKAERPDRLLIVAGCAASLWGESVKKRYPFIDLVSPATQIEKFPELIAEAMKGRWDFAGENATAFAHPKRETLPASGSLFGDSQTAHVTIMRGCNYTCSYCIVPQVRGREVYRALPEILQEIRDKATKGFKEVMLLGQTVNSYYWRNGQVHDFADLLRAVNAVDGIERIRFMSPHPWHMREKVIQAMAESEKVCRHIHLPAQSGSDAVLKRMQRLYTREQYMEIVRRLRAALPGLMITTDIIVGYPGETTAEFSDTLAFLREAEFDGLFAFKFSARPETVAAKEPDDVPADEKESRLQQVLALSKSIVAENALWSN